MSTVLFALTALSESKQSFFISANKFYFILTMAVLAAAFRFIYAVFFCNFTACQMPLTGKQTPPLLW